MIRACAFACAFSASKSSVKVRARIHARPTREAASSSSPCDSPPCCTAPCSSLRQMAVGSRHGRSEWSVERVAKRKSPSGGSLVSGASSITVPFGRGMDCRIACGNRLRNAANRAAAPLLAGTDAAEEMDFVSSMSTAEAGGCGVADSSARCRASTSTRKPPACSCAHKMVWRPT